MSDRPTDGPADPHGPTDAPTGAGGPTDLPDEPDRWTDLPAEPTGPTDGPTDPRGPIEGPVEPAGASRRTRELTRLAVLAVALMFIAAFAFLTFASVVEGGFSLASLLSVFILVLFAVGIVGALRNPPR
jgi:hypothetical protein